jgi:hypothetical protein
MVIPPRCFPEEFAGAAKIAGYMITHAVGLFRQVELYVKIVKFDFVIVLIKIATADIGRVARMIRTPGVARIEIAADADARRLFHSRFAIGDGVVNHSDAAV